MSIGTSQRGAPPPPAGSGRLALAELKPGFGAEILGVDLASCGPDTLAEVVDIFWRNGVVLLRGQSLSPDRQIEITRAFGEPETNQRLEYVHPGKPEIYVISNKVVDGRKIGDVDAGQGWHTDSSFLERPVKCTLLYGVETPPEGADTLFADLCAAWRALPAERQRALEPLRVIHSWRALMELKGVPPSDRDAALPDVVHPLVRTHPADGRKALWVSTGTTRGIEGMDAAAGLELLASLVDFATSERFLYRHRWRPGDLVIWDNRCALHTGTPFDRDRYVRHMRRTWVKGERPV